MKLFVRNVMRRLEEDEKMGFWEEMNKGGIYFHYQKIPEKNINITINITDSKILVSDDLPKLASQLQRLIEDKNKGDQVSVEWLGPDKVKKLMRR